LNTWQVGEHAASLPVNRPSIVCDGERQSGLKTVSRILTLADRAA